MNQKKVFLLVCLAGLAAVGFLVGSYWLRPVLSPSYTFDIPDQGQLATLQAPGADGWIGQEQAARLAGLYCVENSHPAATPSAITAERMSDEEVLERFPENQNGYPSDTLWVVSMDGRWELAGPPDPNGGDTLVTFDTCTVILDARDGSLITLTNQAPK